MRWKTIASAITAAMLTTACAVGPDFRRPDAPDVKAYLPAEPRAPGLVAGADIPAEWWQSFHSPALDALVRRSLDANPNVEAARAALRIAQESAAAQRGAFWPQASASLAPSRQRIADSLSSPLNAPANPFSLHTAQLNIAYAPDVFGGNRRQEESLEAQAESARFELEAARLSLAANVVTAAIQEASLRGQMAATERIIALQAETLDLARRQQALGAIAEAGVAAQEAALAQSRAALPPLRKQLAQTRDLLTALAGGFPDRELEQRFDLEHLELPPELPLSLPSRLVEQRPDVRAAEAQLHAASAQVGVAMANRLPQFSINAGTGSVAGRLSDLFKGGGGFWSLAGAVAQPIFDGGALAHRQSAAEAALDQARAQYRATVIGAFQNVADTLHALDQDTEALRAAAAAERATSRSLALARRQVALGDISHLALLSAEQSWQQAMIALVQARTNQFADTAALFQALGGGWWNQAGQPLGNPL
ncbi:MAG: efflux transporter outer membrane subunit [Rhodocyclaceae bacterium]|nr:efflux transporter outer membrane subunit [Rhodocyclaceae bacterium]